LLVKVVEVAEKLITMTPAGTATPRTAVDSELPLVRMA
jgi:hypothetical protein